MAMKKSDIARFLILRSIGNFLVLFGLFGVGMTFGPALYEEGRYQLDRMEGVTYVVATPHQNPFTGAFSNVIAQTGNVHVLVPPDPFFSIVIPKIGAAERVIPNVDTTNQAEYVAALQKGIAHAKGSVFPGLKGTTYLFAHSTDSWWNVGRYNAVFYLLKDLTVGDDVYVFFNGVRYNYKVVKTEIIDPSDVSLLVNAQTSDEQLVLQTCWPPGTTFKRQMVIAKLIGSN